MKIKITVAITFSWKINHSESQHWGAPNPYKQNLPVPFLSFPFSLSSHCRLGITFTQHLKKLVLSKKWSFKIISIHQDSQSWHLVVRLDPLGSPNASCSEQDSLQEHLYQRIWEPCCTVPGTGPSKLCKVAHFMTFPNTILFFLLFPIICISLSYSGPPPLQNMRDANENG